MTARESTMRLGRTPIDLIVCSSATRWSAAVRIAISAAARRWPQFVFRLHEVEELAHVSRELELASGGIVGLEIGEENLRGCLSWLTSTQEPPVPVVGLLSIAPSPADVYAAEQHDRRAETLATLVREAGAVWTLSSPLETADLLEVAARNCLARPATPPVAHALSGEIWRSLPWQSSRGPLRLTART